MAAPCLHNGPPFLTSREAFCTFSAFEKWGPCLTEKMNCAETVETPIPAPEGRPGAYSYSPRSDEPTARDLRGSTLRTGYCDRKIDVTDKRNFEL